MDKFLLTQKESLIAAQAVSARLKSLEVETINTMITLDVCDRKVTYYNVYVVTDPMASVFEGLETTREKKCALDEYLSKFRKSVRWAIGS